LSKGLTETTKVLAHMSEQLECKRGTKNEGKLKFYEIFENQHMFTIQYFDESRNLLQQIQNNMEKNTLLLEDLRNQYQKRDQPQTIEIHEVNEGPSKDKVLIEFNSTASNEKIYGKNTTDSSDNKYKPPQYGEETEIVEDRSATNKPPVKKTHAQ